MKYQVVLLTAMLALSVQALYLPLAVKETGGAARVWVPTQTGIPLPKGEYTASDLSSFAIYDSATKAAVPASFSINATWDDGSIRFLNTQFSVTVASAQTSRFFLSDGGGNIAGAGEMTVTESAGYITVVTGPLKFSVKAANFNVIDEAYVDLTGQKTFDTSHRIIAPGNAGFLKIGASTSAAATATLSVFLKTAERAVIKADVTVGSHKFLLYYTAFRNKPYVQIIQNWYFNDGTADNSFSLTDLSIHLMTEVTGARHAVTSHTVGDSVAYDLTSTDNTELSYTSNDAYTILAGAASKGSGKGMTSPGIFEEKRMGWLYGSAAGKSVGAGIRFMWQMAPKIIELQSDGELILGLYRYKSQPLTYYGGNGRTHTVFVNFGGDAAATRTAFYNVTQPLYAAPPPVWNCGMTHSLSPSIIHTDPTLFSAKMGTPAQISGYLSMYRLIYQRFGHAYRKAPALQDGVTDLYAFERFGNCTEQKAGCSDQNYSNNYYDFPHLCILGYTASGAAENLELAWIHDIHMMDLNLDNVSGDCKGCPGVGIWYGYQSCTPTWWYNANHWKAQSFFELWYLTGEPILKDFGIRACNRPLTYDFMGGEHRSTGHILEGLSAAYEATWDVKYRDRMRTYFRPIIDSRTTTPTNNYFQNGIVGEGLMYQWFADPSYTHIGEQLKAWGDFEYANQAEYVWGGYIGQCCWLLNGLSVLREIYPSNNNYKVLADSIWWHFINYDQAATQRAKFFNEQYRGPIHYLKYLLSDPNYLSKYPDYLHAAAVEKASVSMVSGKNISAAPNPFRSGTVLQFKVKEQEKVKLEIFDVKGTRIAILVQGTHKPGVYSLPWDREDLAGGVYFARLSAGNAVSIARLLLLK